MPSATSSSSGRQLDRLEPRRLLAGLRASRASAARARGGRGARRLALDVAEEAVALLRLVLRARLAAPRAAPVIAVSGVRSSWAAFATNSRSARSRRSRAEMSVRTRIARLRRRGPRGCRRARTSGRAEARRAPRRSWCSGSKSRPAKRAARRLPGLGQLVALGERGRRAGAAPPCSRTSMRRSLSTVMTPSWSRLEQPAEPVALGLELREGLAQPRRASWSIVAASSPSSSLKRGRERRRRSSPASIAAAACAIRRSPRGDQRGHEQADERADDDGPDRGADDRAPGDHQPLGQVGALGVGEQDALDRRQAQGDDRRRPVLRAGDVAATVVGGVDRLLPVRHLHQLDAARVGRRHQLAIGAEDEDGEAALRRDLRGAVVDVAGAERFHDLARGAHARPDRELGGAASERLLGALREHLGDDQGGDRGDEREGKRQPPTHPDAVAGHDSLHCPCRPSGRSMTVRKSSCHPCGRLTGSLQAFLDGVLPHHEILGAHGSGPCRSLPAARVEAHLPCPREVRVVPLAGGTARSGLHARFGANGVESGVF